MDIDRQADFLLDDFEAWWAVHGREWPSGRPLALAAFMAGVLSTDALLVRMRELGAEDAP